MMTKLNSFIRLSILLILTISAVTLNAQKQLVLLKRGDVVTRFTEGDYMRFKLKNNKFAEGLAVQFTDVSVITLNDTILFSSIYKINSKGHRKPSGLNKLGTVLMIAGLGYFTIDEINTLFFVKGQSGIDEGVVISSLSLVASGAALRFIRSPYQKLRGLSLRTIDSSSRYYRYD
ncbi:MAG: hypothetical protein JNM78_00030 [Cyclobacteriaceae bacterium]|nr:hypothetical protein [Cyclobacteriaceae bacterium]